MMVAKNIIRANDSPFNANLKIGLEHKRRLMKTFIIKRKVINAQFVNCLKITKLYTTQPSLQSNRKGHTKNLNQISHFPDRTDMLQVNFWLVIFLNRSSRENTETCRDGNPRFIFYTQTNQEVSFMEKVSN